MTRASAAAAALAGAAGAMGQVTPIGPFVGEAQEGWETRGSWSICVFCAEMKAFPGDFATLTAPEGGEHMHVTGLWVYACAIEGVLTPEIFGSAGGGGVDWTFDPGKEPGRFGGFFGSNAPAQNGRVEFYDAGGGLVASDRLTTTPCGSWRWHGWEFTVPIRKIRVVGNDPYGGYIQQEEVQWSRFTGGECYADCDDDPSVPRLNIFDFLCFQNRYARNDPYACDCDTGTGPGLCDIFDFLCFQNAYAAGCP